ncbi:MAG: hypothetical protein J4432_03425 [DPANN group archaeon]|nr:hypothetical protein [DPANN group archaeon]
MSKLLVNQSALKEMVKQHGFNSSGDLAEAANDVLEDAIKKACKRCQANGRKTVRGGDL